MTLGCNINQTINGNKHQWGSVHKDNLSNKNISIEFNGRKFKDNSPQSQTSMQVCNRMAEPVHLDLNNYYE